MRVYLDSCCLNRPFDDQSQERIRIESESVRLILARVSAGGLEWIGSDALAWEISKTPSEVRRLQLAALLSAATEHVRVTAETAYRAAELIGGGMDAADALHIACAESSLADVMLTTDDRLLRLCRRMGKRIRVRVANPLQWLMEETAHGNQDIDAG
jgi:predicted nucleic acid-binding protein